MSIEVNKELVVAAKQVYSFSSVMIRKAPIMGLVAVVVFDVLDEKGVKVDEKKITYGGEAFNTFWDEFNSGAYLYNQLIAKADLQAAVSEDSDQQLELEFKNS